MQAEKLSCSDEKQSHQSDLKSSGEEEDGDMDNELADESNGEEQYGFKLDDMENDLMDFNFEIQRVKISKERVLMNYPTPGRLRKM